MRAELQQQLYDKYPRIFAPKSRDPRKSCMVWGIECGDGWFSLLDSLCRFLQYYTDNNKVEQVVAQQVKEKFGGLRFYYSGGNDFVPGAVCMAETLSESTCEECGAPGRIEGEGWLTALCDTHRELRNK